MMKLPLFVAFLATVPAANWMIGHVGTCIPNGPCLVPVGFGLMAPSGVLLIGLALILRDAVHSAMGGKLALLAIFLGAAASALVAPPSLVIASAVAFLISELADFAVYAPLRRRHLVVAVLASGVVGSAIDSATFLALAFGSLDLMAGQFVGKIWATLGVSVYVAMRQFADGIYGVKE